MNSRQRIFRIVTVLMVIIALGVAGYMVIEGWSFFDALYMTIITLSTVGYNEVHGLSAAGRAFSIVLIIGGVGGMLYTLTTIVQYLVEGQLANVMGRHRMKSRISKLKGHIIICGYRRVGRAVAQAFKDEGIPMVVVDVDQKALSRAAIDGRLYVHGDATRDEILKDAGIKNARALVAALGSDVDNVFITLSAKGLRPDISVVARVSDESSESKLIRAGADKVISPHRIGGRHMAMLTLRPLVLDYIDTTMHIHGREMIIENLKVGSDSPVAGLTVDKSLKCCGALDILAVKKNEGNLITKPSGDIVIEAGDELVIIGTREHLRLLEG